MAGAPPTGPGPYQQPPQGYPQQAQQYGQPAQQQVNPQAPYGVHPRLGLPYSDKQKLVAALLQIFLGGFGVGRFYTGHTNVAIAQIAVTWVTCGIGGIWPFIDGILMLTNDEFLDANGLPLRPN